MKVQTGMIIYFIRLLVINLCVYYGFMKISNTNKTDRKNIVLVLIINFILTLISVCINYKVNFLLSILVLIVLYGTLLGIVTKLKVGYAIAINIISYAICIICYGISTVLSYIPYKILDDLFHIENIYISLLMILIIQLILIYLFYKIKRIKNGFSFLQNKLNNDFADIIIINIGTIIILLYCLIGTKYDDITWSLLITFIIVGLETLLMIQKLFIMSYKQKLLKETLKEYEKRIKDKEIEIEQLKDDKFNISKITHEFYNRQKALELLVEQNINGKSDITKENTSENILNMIKNLNDEYSKEFDKIKRLPKLETTGITEIDTMFKYMQSECMKNNIEFKLKIIGNVYPLINNIIEKSKLETLIGDHVRDAINAVITTDTENKEILVILGVKDQRYELSIYDTGKEFGIKILSKLGLEATTTNSNKGGSGIGFLTTFDTMKETKASLIISEFPIEKEKYFTKSVTIRFDNKNEYKICSYRASEIRKHKGNRNIVIEKI